MNATQEVVAAIAVECCALQQMYMDAPRLAHILNSYGLFSTRGKPYVTNGRGIYRVIVSTWEQLHAKGDMTARDAVAKWFLKPDGTHAYPCQCPKVNGRCGNI